MANDHEDVQITLFVDIRSSVGIKSKGELLVHSKSYGPFKISVSELNDEDMYKCMVYTLLKNNFTLLSAETITAIGCKIITHNKQFFKDHKMGALKLQPFFLNEQQPIKSYGENTCVLDYVWNQCRGRKGFKTYTYDKLKEEIMDYTADFPMISTQELIEWLKVCHTNVSIHAYDARYHELMNLISHPADISLVYFVKDHHC